MSSYREESQGVVSLRLYEPSECKNIVEGIRQLDGWNAALIRQGRDGGNHESVARSDIRSASTLNSVDVARLYEEFETKIESLVKPLIRQLWKLDLTNHLGTHLLRYEAADHYVPHTDTGLGFEERYFSLVCYLNDDFEGGRTLFPTLNYAVTPEAGQAILFPSNYLHGSEPVVSGKKFIFVSWIEGPVPINWL